MRQSAVNIMSRSKKKGLVTGLDDLSAQLSSLLEIDHPCAQRHIADARRVVEVTTNYPFFLKKYYIILHEFCFFLVNCGRR